MLETFWHSIVQDSSSESEQHEHVTGQAAVLLTFFLMWPAVNANCADRFGMQTLGHCNCNRTTEVNPLWTLTAFQNWLAKSQLKPMKKWEAGILSHRLWKPLRQYAHTPVLKGKVTFITKLITRLSLYLEMWRRLTGSLETNTGWQISGAFISKKLSQLFKSSSVFRGQVENSAGYSKSKSFKIKIHQGISSINFPSPSSSPLFCSHLFFPFRSPLLCFCQKWKWPEYCFFHCRYLVGQLLKWWFSSWYFRSSTVFLFVCFLNICVLLSVSIISVTVFYFIPLYNRHTIPSLAAHGFQKKRWKKASYKASLILLRQFCSIRFLL